MVTTDLTIGKSDLSFHYLFELIRTRGTPDIDLVRKETLLDERMSQYSLNRWIQRFNRDCIELHKSIGTILPDNILNEGINFGEMFCEFYQQTGRFFLHDNKTNVIIA